MTGAPALPGGASWEISELVDLANPPGRGNVTALWFVDVTAHGLSLLSAIVPHDRNDPTQLTAACQGQVAMLLAPAVQTTKHNRPGTLRPHDL